MTLQKIYRFLSSSKFAMGLLIAILACCIAGVTIIRGERAWSLIFTTAWFNGLLVLLVVNVAFCFFGRIWGKRLTLISFGMILFHLSFVAVFAGVVYNSLFYFRGDIRLTEGETLPSGDPKSYDLIDKGRFFDFSKLKGETTLIAMHTDYKVDGRNKKWAYEIRVGEEGKKKEGIVYVTNHLNHNGFRYFRDKEGYSLLIMLHNAKGEPLTGQFIPIQSLKQRNGDMLYTSGSSSGPASFPFPYPDGPAAPVMHLLVAYYPDPKTPKAGKIDFQVWPLDYDQTAKDGKAEIKPAKEGKAADGEEIDFSSYHEQAAKDGKAADGEEIDLRSYHEQAAEGGKAEIKPAKEGKAADGEEFDFSSYHEQAAEGGKAEIKPAKEGKAALGEKFDFGGHYVSVEEVRYWTGMSVKYDPGQPVVLASLWAGLAGLVLTLIGRIRSKSRQLSAFSKQ